MTILTFMGRMRFGVSFELVIASMIASYQVLPCGSAHGAFKVARSISYLQLGMPMASGYGGRLSSGTRLCFGIS